MITYTWKITSMATMPSPPAPINDFAVLIDYIVMATDGTNTANFQSQVQILIDQTLDEKEKPTYTKYSDLTEEQVIGWIQTIENLVNVAETNLDGQLYAINNPPIVPKITPLPWASK